MKFHINIILLLLTVLSLLPGCGGHKTEDAADVATAVPDEAVNEAVFFDTEGLTVTEGKVKSGDNFSGVFIRLGLSASEAYNLSEACKKDFDVRILRAGNKYRAYYSESEATGRVLEYVEYEKDRVNTMVFKCTLPYEARAMAKEITVEQRFADVTINSSLWNDMLDAGVTPLLVLTLSDIYAWTVDFFGLQKGDRFRVFFDEKICDGSVIAVDTVRYAVFTHAGKDFPAVMFNQKDGGNVYWNREGESMRKAFLKAPLQYSRISSGFSYARRHPVTRKVQPHTGVDYAAPTGTPVMTIGDGVVTSMKNEGAGGNTVRIKHNSVYSTAYLHLSKFASGLEPGQRVRQGEVIGYVGSTGRSTGPHLDFRVWKNGTPINPLKMESPPAEPLKKAFKEDFEQTALHYEHRLYGMSADVLLTRLFDAL